LKFNGLFPYKTDVFCKFKDQEGKFKESIRNDIKGMLSLYEASQLRLHGEDILEEAYSFTLIGLTKSLATKLSPFLSLLVHHSLGQSLRKGMPRLEARYYISFYQEDPSHNEHLLAFAKLDFNVTEAPSERSQQCDSNIFLRIVAFYY